LPDFEHDQGRDDKDGGGDGGGDDGGEDGTGRDSSVPAASSSCRDDDSAYVDDGGRTLLDRMVVSDREKASPLYAVLLPLPPAVPLCRGGWRGGDRETTSCNSEEKRDVKADDDEDDDDDDELTGNARAGVGVSPSFSSSSSGDCKSRFRCR
jgi:hypothetical protein